MLRNADVKWLRSRVLKALLGQRTREFRVTCHEMRQRKLGLDLVDIEGRFEGLDDRARALQRWYGDIDVSEVTLCAAETHQRPRSQRRAVGLIGKREAAFGKLKRCELVAAPDSVRMHVKRAEHLTA